MPRYTTGKKSDVPAPVCGIQVNFCKNMDCSRFGVPASHKPEDRGSGKASKDGYVLGVKKRFRKTLTCKKCDQTSMVKSNQGVFEEAARLSSYLDVEPVVKGCTREGCQNATVDVSQGLPFYRKTGKTETGSQRYLCKSCGKNFSISNNPHARQRVYYKNKLILKMLMAKAPFTRICEVMEISMTTLYRKIDFLHKQCIAFAADRERKLLDKISISRLYLQSDRQDYIVNWTNTFDKRNVVLKAIGTADSRSGYVFGMHLNYDPGLDPRFVNAMALQAGDDKKSLALRDFARVWLDIDHKVAARSRPRKVQEPLSEGTLGLDIAERYQEALGREEIEASDDPEDHIQLPQRGVQIHEEYTMYGHFYFLKKLLANVEKVRFFIDQDSGLRAACMTAFNDEILYGSCDVFYVRINKDLKIHEKLRLVGMCNKEMEAERFHYPGLSDKSIRIRWIMKEMKRLSSIGHWQDRWLEYPIPDMSEPEKAICYLTDRDDMEEMQLANLYHMASLHKIDSYFNQIRARVSSLGRPQKSKSNQDRMWTGYQLYNPATAQKLLDIFRVYHNFFLKHKIHKKTPAMKLGLAKAQIPVDDIINFREHFVLEKEQQIK